MKRLLLDTNIYGLLFADVDFHLIHSRLEQNKDELMIYGFDVIRKELKQAPKKVIKKVNIQASKKAYQEVNKKNNLRLPEFIGYKNFKDNLLRSSLSDPFIDSSNKLWIFLSFFNIFPFIFNFHDLYLKKNLYINIS